MSKPLRPASFSFELSPIQRGSLAAQRAAKKPAYDSRSIISEMNPLTRNNGHLAGGSDLRKSAQAMYGRASDVALGKASKSDPSALTKSMDVKGKRKARETHSQTGAECKDDASHSRQLGRFGGEDGTGSYCVIEESTLSLPAQTTETASSKSELEAEAKTEAEGVTETTSAAGESSQGGLTRAASSSSSPRSSSSSATAPPAESSSPSTSRSSRHIRTPSAVQSSQIRNIDSFMDLNLEYATLRAPRREIIAAQQQASPASPSAPPASASASTLAATSTASASSVAEGGSESYDWEKRMYLQGARGSLGRPPQW